MHVCNMSDDGSFNVPRSTNWRNKLSFPGPKSALEVPLGHTVIQRDTVGVHHGEARVHSHSPEERHASTEGMYQKLCIII